MNYNFRLTVAKDPKLQVPIPAPKHYDAARYSLLGDWLRDQDGAEEAGETLPTSSTSTRGGTASSS